MRPTRASRARSGPQRQFTDERERTEAVETVCALGLEPAARDPSGCEATGCDPSGHEVTGCFRALYGHRNC
ncbi:hypothetical protein Shyd_88750 [Streptomyces hydrogenans]|uniref:Uncharacterized protein n=1 Tax=Streptomyces hydrogenans TaxID=1873719 RepID=A0ABQ3PR57_9ACTN|nr:hypothetical protein GCM10018784_39970 [Streptomyces hydrogenans]GHI27504.1 hypothetical protein Shyd_88750 [Streptomyces hydrogenans]